MDLYFKQRASLSAGCVIKPKGNISSFVGFERMGLEPLKVNFKNICSVFSQAPNIPQNPVHFHSLGIAEGRSDHGAAPDQHKPSRAPRLGFVSWLSLHVGGMSPCPNCCWHWYFWVFHLETCWKRAPPPHCVRRSCGTTPASAAPTASAQPRMGLVFEAEEMSMKINFPHEKHGIMYLTCLLSIFSV